MIWPCGSYNMKTINYDIIRDQIYKSKFYQKSYFDEVRIKKEIFLVPIKYHPSIEFRNLAVLSCFPYIYKMAVLSARRFVRAYPDCAYMTIDDFAQDCAEAMLRWFHWWKPEKFKLTTMANNMMIWRISTTYNFRKVIRDLKHRAYQFIIDNNGYEIMFEDWLERMEIYTDYDIRQTEDRILLERFLVAIKKRLTEKQYKIFRMRYLDQMSYREIGERFKVCKERVRQWLYGFYKDRDRRKTPMRHKGGGKYLPDPNSIIGKIQALKKAWGY